MPRVELIFLNGCPNLQLARERLGEALRRRGRAVRWDEWDAEGESLPAHVSGYGSPTVLVDGRDVLGAGPTHGSAPACRTDGAPSVSVIEEALRRAERDR